MDVIKELLSEIYAFLATILVNFGIELPDEETIKGYFPTKE